MEKIKRIERTLVHRGQILEVYTDTIETPTGHQAKWDFMHHIGAAAVVPVREDGKILMVRQYRNALDRESLEIPAGGRNSADEPTIECASRELEEETGYRSENIQFLISSCSALAYCDEIIDVYVAYDLIPSKQHLDEDEFIELEAYTPEELSEMIFAGKIQDSKTIAAIMAYRVKSGL